MNTEQKLKEEAELVSAVRTLCQSDVEKFQLSDVTIRRFLRARKCDVQATKRGIERHCQWRVEEKVDEIKEHDISGELQSGKIQVHGKDKSDRPVVYIFAVRHNKDHRDLEEMKKFIIFTLEKALALTKPDEEKMDIVFDLNGFNKKCMDYDVVKLLINILGFNYPETLQVAYVVNAPFIFWACWVIIKPWLDPITAAKVKIVKKEELLNIISYDQLHEVLSSTISPPPASTSTSQQDSTAVDMGNDGSVDTAKA